MSARLHAIGVAILIVRVHLLLFLIECAAKTATELVGAPLALADVGLRVRDARWATGSLVLKIGIILIDHLVQEVVIYQIALAVRILLICCDRRRDVVSLEADGRSVLALVVVKLTRKFGSERRLLHLLVRGLVLVLDWLVRVVLVSSLKHLERVLVTCGSRDPRLLVTYTAEFGPSIEAGGGTRPGLCLCDAVDYSRRTKLVVTILTHSHIEFLFVLVLLIGSVFVLSYLPGGRVQGHVVWPS